MKQNIFAILAATLWISFSEFFRNQILFLSIWVEHYENLGLTFPAENINGFIWGLWSLALAISITVIATKFSFRDTVIIAWLTGFVMMWLVIGNMKVLPIEILIFAVPLSLLEVIIATLLVYKIRAPKQKP